jgi:hypothetical protein
VEVSTLLLLFILAVLLVVALAILVLACAACLLLVGLLPVRRSEEEGDKEVWVPIGDPGGETWVPLISPQRGPPRDREEAGR